MTLLTPFEMLFGALMNARNALYDGQRLRSHPLGAPAISIGNITAGGTGKTPVARLVAEILAESGEKVCILTRGYGRLQPSQQVIVSDGNHVLADAAAGGDEPVELARRLIGKAAVISNADRVAAAAWAIEHLGSTCFVLDDAFQHRRAQRDLDIVCIDASVPFINERMLPTGLLREPLKHLARADAIVVTRTEAVADLTSLIDDIKRFSGGARIFTSQTALTGLIPLPAFLDGQYADAAAITPAAAFVFCGIGNPKSFFSLLTGRGINIGGTSDFRDHHRYTQADVDRIQDDARNVKCATLITTGKDAVKLSGLDIEMPCLVAVADIQVNEADEFRRMVTSFS